jgi:hypothetical protein
MADADVTVELDYEDGFREGFLHGFMSAHFAPDDGCERDDCPRQE